MIVGQKRSRTDGLPDRSSSNLRAFWRMTPSFALIANLSEGERGYELLQQAYRDPLDGLALKDPSSLEDGHGRARDLGVRFESWNRRLEGTLVYFDAERLGFLVRDWEKERSLQQGYDEAGLDLFPPPVYRQLPRVRHEGLSLNATLNPSPSLSLRFGGYASWAENPLLGEPNSEASLFGRYLFRSGNLEGLQVGGGFRYRDRVDFNDGFALPETWLLDLMFGYKWGEKVNYRLALNLKNLTSEPYLAHRFSIERGASIGFTFKARF